MNSQLRVVFDCNIFLQALGSPNGPAGRCFELAADGQIELCISRSVLDEFRDVANRPKIIARLRLTPERIDRFAALIETASTLFESIPARFHFPRDPDDAHYVDLALAAEAKVIVSRDNDLLDLVNPNVCDSNDFRTRFPTLRILDPISFLNEFFSKN